MRLRLAIEREGSGVVAEMLRRDEGRRKAIEAERSREQQPL